MLLKGAYKGVAHLMVRYDAAFLLAHDPVLLLLTYQHNLHCLEQVLLGHGAASMLNRIDGCLIHHVGQVGAHGARGSQGNILKVHALIQKHILGMYLEDVDTSIEVRLIHYDTPVKTSGTEQGRVQDFRTVGCAQYQKSLGGIKTIHLGKKLVQCLLTLIIAAHTAVTAASNGINLVDENDTGRILRCILKQVTDTGGAHTHEHFHKVGTGQGVERHMGLACHCLCKQGLTGSRRSHKQGALWKLCAYLGIFAGIVQEIHNLGQGFLGLVLAGHVFEGDAGLLLHVHLGVALAHAHDSPAAHALHGEIHEEQQEQEWDRIIEEYQQKGIGVLVFLVCLHIIIQETVHELIIPRHLHHIVIQILGILRIILLWHDCNLGAAYLDGFHFAAVHHLDKFIVGQLLALFGIQVGVHPAHQSKCKQCSNQQHGDGLPVALHIRILFVIIIHIVQILPLNGPIYHLPTKTHSLPL